jgi:nicotinate-nucleotide pyrophosphorylase (carboxylating)
VSENYLNALERLLKTAIEEDIGTGDVTSDAIFPEDHRSDAVIISKEKGVFCGGEVIRRCYEKIDRSINTVIRVPDGKKLEPGDKAAEIRGNTGNILRGERIVLNFIQRMSGIATMTARLVSIMEGSEIKILDTRKTLPGHRLLDKYAVKTGGGQNHRMGLYDMVMIKDNHIKAAGSISSAVETVRNAYDRHYRVEVETTNTEEVREAVSAGADIIMLDNMDIPEMRESIEIIHKKAEIEVSGNITGERLTELKELDIDYISIGALTHSVKAFDLSMKITGL